MNPFLLPLFLLLKQSSSVSLRFCFWYHYLHFLLLCSLLILHFGKWIKLHVRLKWLSCDGGVDWAMGAWMIRFHSRHFCEECAATKPVTLSLAWKAWKLWIPPHRDTHTHHHYFTDLSFSQWKSQSWYQITRVLVWRDSGQVAKPEVSALSACPLHLVLYAWWNWSNQQTSSTTRVSEQPILVIFLPAPALVWRLPLYLSGCV